MDLRASGLRSELATDRPRGSEGGNGRLAARKGTDSWSSCSVERESTSRPPPSGTCRTRSSRGGRLGEVGEGLAALELAVLDDAGVCEHGRATSALETLTSTSRGEKDAPASDDHAPVQATKVESLCSPVVTGESVMVEMTDEYDSAGSLVMTLQTFVRALSQPEAREVQRRQGESDGPVRDRVTEGCEREGQRRVSFCASFE